MWIKVEDRLPDTDAFVLMCTKIDTIHIGYYVTDRNKWITDSGYVVEYPNIPPITHWQPLPDLPKEED